MFLETKLTKLCCVIKLNLGTFFYDPPSSGNASYVGSAGTVTWPPHLTRPCLVALGRVLIWVMSPDRFEELILSEIATNADRWRHAPPLLWNTLSVSLLHSTLTSRPSYLARKGAALCIQKTQTYTTIVPSWIQSAVCWENAEFTEWKTDALTNQATMAGLIWEVYLYFLKNLTGGRYKILYCLVVIKQNKP